ncbi:MAG: hypothetical protein LBD35_02075 [Prevotellaceae bacterium]|nr:hypothetical protein [Prevotellaceae bacterium]
MMKSIVCKRQCSEQLSDRRGYRPRNNAGGAGGVRKRGFADVARQGQPPRNGRTQHADDTDSTDLRRFESA